MYAHFSSLLALPLFGVLVGVQGAASTARVRSSQSYKVQDWYEGYGFFSDWTFFSGSDPTGGNVNYLSMQDATSQGLAYVDGNNAIVLAVDSTSNVPAGGNRNSCRITSNKNYNGGLFIMDVAAMPVGCGTWPSIWTVGPNWPYGGEIDIVEGINDQPSNQMTLHSGTSNPCSLSTSQREYTGQVLHNQCYSTANSDSGCSILDKTANSFAYGFNGAQGGVFAFLWDPQAGMSMWHFTRANVPSDITNQSPTPSNWGTPAGFWSASTCDISANFYNHQIVIDTTICGSWAGNQYPQSGCPGTCSDMVANSTNFVDAKWVINYLAVYQPGN